MRISIPENRVCGVNHNNHDCRVCGLWKNAKFSMEWNRMPARNVPLPAEKFDKSMTLFLERETKRKYGGIIWLENRQED